MGGPDGPVRQPDRPARQRGAAAATDLFAALLRAGPPDLFAAPACGSLDLFAGPTDPPDGAGWPELFAALLLAEPPDLFAAAATELFAALLRVDLPDLLVELADDIARPTTREAERSFLHAAALVEHAPPGGRR